MAIASNIQDLVKELTPATDTKPKTYTAEVSHTDDEGIVWVRLPGAEQDTPTASTSSEVKMGDTVTVEWRNNKLYIAGNYTNPSAGVTRVSKVEQTAEKAMSDAETAQATADSAQETATEAITIAGDTDQHFWFTETGTDTGAHITEATQEDFLADPSSGGGNLLARSNGIAVRDGLTELSAFAASGARVGQTGQSHVEMDYHSMQLKDKEGNTYFYVSDLRNENGVASVTDTFIGDGRITGFMLNLTATDNTYSVSVSDGSGGTIGKTTTHVYFASAPTKDAVITVTYSTESTDAKAYTLGKRASGTAIGPYSHAEGYNTAASGIHSHAEGTITVAAGPQAHAEGNNTRATKYYAHSEGFQTRANGTASHAEGISAKANGSGAHAEGCETIAGGEFSHASGINTEAGYESQTVIGRYNDNQQNNAFEIGNGESENARSNAFTVDWNGNTTATGALAAKNGQSDAQFMTIGGSTYSYVEVVFGSRTLRLVSNSNGNIGLYDPSVASWVIRADNYGAVYAGYDGKLTINGHSSEIGAFKSARLTTDLSVNTSTWTILCSLTLSAGTWVLVGYADFNPNATGQRVINLHTTGGANFRQIEVNAANGYTTLETTLVVKIAQDTTYFLNVWQNSGTAITMREGTDGGYTNGIRAVRIA